MDLPDFIVQITTPTPCRDNPDMWTDGASSTDRREAKTACYRCPVIAQCAGWALPRPDEYGIWGGTTEDDRRVWRSTGQLPQRRRRPSAVPGGPRLGCGTEAAYRRHRAAGVDCAVCREELLARVMEPEGHGTAGMYKLELLLGVPRCGECREWCRAKSASRRAQRTAVTPVAGAAVREVTEFPTGRQTAAQPFGKAA